MLLDANVDVATKAQYQSGQMALHWAAFGGDVARCQGAKDLCYAILDHSTWESFLDCTTEARLRDPFMVPLDRLYKTLTMWKPRTFWEMRHQGYGNVDVVQLYGFHFGIMVGIAHGSADIR
jgi:hypothetical protein